MMRWQGRCPTPQGIRGIFGSSIVSYLLEAKSRNASVFASGTPEGGAQTAHPPGDHDRPAQHELPRCEQGFVCLG
jgi:hypothetical protein